MRNISFLVVDDDKIFQTVLQKKIDKACPSSEIMAINCPIKAIDYLNNIVKEGANFPDYIFVDINMPILEGWDIAKALTPHKKRLKKTKIYVISSSILKSDIDKVKQYSILNGYITKPVSVNVIKQITDDNKRAQYSLF